MSIMDTQQIIQNLPTMSMEDLQLLSKAVDDEMNPSFDKLDIWVEQRPCRKYEWVIYHFMGVYHAALVIFHSDEIELHKGSSTDEISAKRIALRSALYKLVEDLAADRDEDIGSVRKVDSDSEVKWGGRPGENKNEFVSHLQTSYKMKWDKKKKIYTDGRFVYTSLEKVYGSLLKNGKIRPITRFEMLELTRRGIQFEHIADIRDIQNIKKQQYDPEKSSSEESEAPDSSDSESSDADLKGENEYKGAWNPSDFYKFSRKDYPTPCNGVPGLKPSNISFSQKTSKSPGEETDSEDVSVISSGEEM